MSANRNHFSLFGLDFAAMFIRWKESLAEALGRPSFHWLGLQEPVHVSLPDGVFGCYRDYRPCACSATPSITALLLPQDAVLTRILSMPRMTSSELKTALELEVESLTPFTMEDTLWGYRRLTMDQAASGPIILAITSRTLLNQHMAITQASSANHPDEIWGSTEHGPVPFLGFNEQRRIKRQNLNQKLAWAILGFICLLIVTLAAIPAIISHHQHQAAAAMFENLRSQTQPLMAARDRLTRFQGLALELETQRAGQPDFLAILEKLSATIPDGAWLERIEWQGRTLQLSGLADNGTALLNLLTKTEGLGEARSTSPFTRDARLNKDRFSIEIRLTPVSGEAS